jgi:selenocysteine lyase/cysteine desulfurase
VISRRTFLNRTTLLSSGPWWEQASSPAPAGPPSAPVSTASENDPETLWRDVQSAFTLDRTIVNLNNGGVSPSPRVVIEAVVRYARLLNQAPAQGLERLTDGLERVRRGLAGELGCDPEELAVTRNTSEALQTVQLGLPLKPGDEVLTTNQDYGRMLDTWAQRARRDGILLTRIAFPVPATLDDLVGRFERAITRRTRVLHFCHMTARTGQVFPVRALCELARRRNIQTVVDGAHGFAHLPFRVRDLGCDYYASSLHKWLQAPIGTGLLYVRRDRIDSLWPLRPAPPRLKGDIRKFEAVGTDQIAYRLGVLEALAFHRAIGVERKSSRLRALRDRWLEPIAGLSRVRLLTHPDPARSCGIGSFSVRGIEPEVVAGRLWERGRIVVLPIWHREYRGVRVTPGVHTTLDEIDRFVDVLRDVVVGRP